MGGLEPVGVKPEVLGPGELTLAELAGTANREHGLALGSGVAMVEHAIRAGDALLAVRARMVHGDWLPWLQVNFEVGQGQASRYMRIAASQEMVRAAGVTSVNEACRLIPAIVPAPGKELREQAKDLLESGLTQAEVARTLGVSATTVYRWGDGGRERNIRANQRRRERHRLEAERRREREIKRAVRKEGGALAEAYSAVSRLDAVLGQARKEARSKDIRLAVNQAHALRDKMMEQLVQALGVS